MIFYKQITLLLVAMIIGRFHVVGQCTTSSGNWELPTTWTNCGGSIPSATSTVIIAATPSGSSAPAIVSGTLGNQSVGTIEVGSITVQNGGTLRLHRSVDTLFLQGRLIIEDGGELQHGGGGPVLIVEVVDAQGVAIHASTPGVPMPGLFLQTGATITQASNPTDIDETPLARTNVTYFRGGTLGTPYSMQTSGDSTVVIDPSVPPGSIHIRDLPSTAPGAGFFPMFDVVSTPRTHQSQQYRRHRSSGFPIVIGPLILDPRRPWDAKTGIYTQLASDRLYIGRVTGVLPLELISFTASMQGSEVVVSWETLTELNNDYFSVAHSVNGIDWADLGEVRGAGTTSVPQHYSFLHRVPSFGINYYKLVQTDYDGTMKETGITNVLNAGQHDLVVYPNPSSGTTIIDTPGEGRITVIDLTGKTLVDMPCSTSNVAVDLPKGLHVVEFTLNGHTLQKRVLVR